MKKLLTFALAMLMCVVIVGTSLAEYGYTKLSQIPAAVDFTFEHQTVPDSRGRGFHLRRHL